jgi:hypothetical protein
VAGTGARAAATVNDAAHHRAPPCKALLVPCAEHGLVLPLLAAADTVGAYKNWGVYQPGGKTEPFTPSGGPAELCGVGNYSQMSQGVAGWSNSQCTNKFIWMCKIRCERR